MTQFFQGYFTDGARHTVYTVPAGKRIVVTSATFSNQAGSAGTCDVSMLSGGVTVVIAYVAVGSPGHSGQWSGRAVLNEGDQLQVSGAGGGYYGITVGGYTYYL